MRTADLARTSVEVVGANALDGVTVGLSVSESQDLTRLGLTAAHCDLAVAEIARAILLAGGSLAYGGRLHPEPGFTRILLDEVQRYGRRKGSLKICLPETEHRAVAEDELERITDALGWPVDLVLLDREGRALEAGARPPADVVADPQEHDRAALSAMRNYIVELTGARIVVGGRLTGYQGAMPGVVEEAILSVAAHQPLYVAGGFGGAAAAIAKVLGRDDQRWAPPGFPAGADREPVRQALQQLVQAEAEQPAPADGLSEDERRQLAASSRPAEIAGLFVTGLSRTRPPS